MGSSACDSLWGKVPFTRYGGKARKLRFLLSHIPYSRIYCEPFLGSGAVFFARDPSEIEVINDIDYDVVNFFSVLRDEAKLWSLCRRLYWTPYSRIMFKEAQRRLRRSVWGEFSVQKALEGDVERAYWWYISIVQSVNDSGYGWSWTRSHPPRQAWAVLYLPLFGERLRRAYIECADWREVCERWDSEETVFYLDPPYLESVISSIETARARYRGVWDERAYEGIIEFCLSARGSITLSNYDAEYMLGKEHPLFQKLLDAGWRKERYKVRVIGCYRGERDKERSAPKREDRRIEVVFLNPKCQELLSSAGALNLGVKGG